MNRRAVLQSLLFVIASSEILFSADLNATWKKDFHEALREAEQTQRPLLLHFSAKWCGPCQRMERHVLNRPELADFLGRKFIAVKIDSDQHPDLVRRFSVRSLPSDIIVDPGNGRSVVHLDGSQDLSGYLQGLTRAEKRYQDVLQQRLAQSGKTPEKSLPKANENPATQPKTNDTLPAVAGDPIVGLEGYSPVALSRDRTWKKGLPDFAWDHKGVTYLLSTNDELRDFKTDPERFAPRLLGCDAVVLHESDRAVAGSIEFGAFYDEELYFFATADSREQFKANPHRYIRTQHVLKVDQIQAAVR